MSELIKEGETYLNGSGSLTVLKYKKPSLDHIIPKAKGGTNDIENLQFLSWFENRCKNDMTQTEWDILKLNIQEYFI